jgi:hypothetical protein
MKQPRLFAVAVVLGAASCAPYIVKDDVVGPHGEQVIELACASPDQCMSFARETCRGNFDIVTNDYSAPQRAQVGGSPDIMMVHCQNAPGGPPVAAHVVAPDAGP